MTLSARSMPLRRWLWRSESVSPEPTAASTWNHASRSACLVGEARRAGRSRRGRSCPRCRRSRSRARRSGSRRGRGAPVSSVGTPITAFVPRPSSAAERRTLSCAAARRHDPPLVGRQPVGVARPSPARSRASSSPSRFDAVPPIVITPEPAVAEAVQLREPRDERVLHERARGRGVEGIHRLVGDADREFGRGGGDQRRGVEVGDRAGSPSRMPPARIGAMSSRTCSSGAPSSGSGSSARGHGELGGARASAARGARRCATASATAAPPRAAPGGFAGRR